MDYSKKVSRFERKTGFETFTDMVVETAQTLRENPNMRFDKAWQAGARRASFNEQSLDYQEWSGAVSAAFERIG